MIDGVAQKFDSKVERGELTLGARTPSSANACAARASPKRAGGEIYCSRCALNAGEGAHAPSIWPHYYPASFWAQPMSNSYSLSDPYFTHLLLQWCIIARKNLLV